jgi:hypothetical protein
MHFAGSRSGVVASQSRSDAMGATAAAAVIIRKERELVEHFTDAGAVSPSSARSPSDLGVHERFAWIRLVERGVIREAAPGRYYFDEPTWVALRRRRRQLSRVLMIFAGVLAVAMMIVTQMGARQ